MKTQVVCGGLSFEEAPLEVREKIAFLPATLPHALKSLKQELGLSEAVIISTCNRVEYFGATYSSENIPASWIKFLREFHQLDYRFSLPAFNLQGAACVEHLYQVAAGLKSMVLGETEILGQIKEAYQTAVFHGSTGKWLNRLFQSSFAAAKEVRSRTAITRGHVSVASVAVGLAEKIFGQLENCRVLVIGAGDTSEKTIRALQSRGLKSLTITNRTDTRALALAQEYHGSVLPWADWKKEVSSFDIIISSTNASEPLLMTADLKTVLHQRSDRALFLIDLAVPRDFDPAINRLDGVYLYNLDNLQQIAQGHLEDRQAAIGIGHQLLQPHVDRFCAWASLQEKAAIHSPDFNPKTISLA